MASSSGTVVNFIPAEHSHLIPYLAALHAQCINTDRTMSTFLPPLSHDKLLSWWREKIAEVARGQRLLLMLLDEFTAGSKPQGKELMGVVMLKMHQTETQPFRAVVEELMVNSKFRRRGGARNLMAALEEESRARQKTLLMLDTQHGGAAHDVFKRLGFVEIGVVPGYGISPGGEIKDGVFFYKKLQ